MLCGYREPGRDEPWQNDEYNHAWCDKFQAESDRLDFTFKGCRSMTYVENIISELDPAVAVQAIMSLIETMWIDSGR